MEVVADGTRQGEDVVQERGHALGQDLVQIGVAQVAFEAAELALGVPGACRFQRNHLLTVSSRTNANEEKTFCVNRLLFWFQWDSA